MSKRLTYLLGGAATAVGIALIVIAFTALSDDGGGSSQQDSDVPGEQPSGSTGATGNPSRVSPRGRSVEEAVGERRAVRAPGFAVEVLEKGSPPAGGKLKEAVAGDILPLARLRGSPVVLHVWSSSCGPCRPASRLVETTWQRWGRRGVAFLGLSVDRSAAAAIRFANEYDLTYPTLRDGAGRVASAYGVRNLPETFFISSAGEIVGHVDGSPTVRQLELGTAAARTGRPFGNEEGGSRVRRR